MDLFYLKTIVINKIYRSSIYKERLERTRLTTTDDSRANNLIRKSTKSYPAKRQTTDIFLYPLQRRMFDLPFMELS